MASVGGGRDLIVGRGLVEVLPDFRKWGKQLAADMRLARTQLDGTTSGFKKSASTIGASMAAAGKGASLVAVGVAAGSLKMAGDFQAHTAVLQTAAGETTKGLATVRKGILSISENTGTGIKNLTDGMYTIEKAGFRGSEGLKVLKAAAQGAREENANLADVTNAMTSVMASYHLKANQSVMVMNAMKTAAGEGKINMEEFSGALSTVLPIASANKISFDQVAGAMATLTQHGTSAREATHELGATIRALASPNMVAQREMARFGLSSVDVSQNLGKRGLTGTIELLTSTILRHMGPSGKILLSAFEGTKQSAEDARIMLSKMPPDLQKVAKQFLSGKIEADQWNATIKGAPVAVQPMLRNFNVLVNRSRGFSRELKSGGPAAKTYTDALKRMSGGAIGLNTILQLSGESFDGFKERVRKVGDSLHHNTKDVEGWKTTQKLLNVQLDMVKQRLQVMAITIGTKLIPVVAGATKFFTAHKIVLTLVVGAVLSLVGVLTTAYVVQKTYAAYTAISTAATWAWNAATQEGGVAILVLRAQLAALWVMQKLQAVATGIATAAQWAFNAAMSANPITLIVIAIAALVAAIVYVAVKTKFFQTIWAATWGFIKKVTLGFVHWLKANWQLVIFTILTGGIGLAVAMIVRHWNGVKHAFSLTINWIKHNWPLLLAIITGPIGLAVLYIVKHWKQITDGASHVWHNVAGFFVNMGKDIGTFFSKLPGEVGRFFSSLPGIIGHWTAQAAKSVGSFFSKLPGQIASAATGFGKALVSGGQDLIKGLFHGATTFFTQSVPNFFKTVWHGIVDFFKAVFGIHSPSTVMAALGIDLIKGLFVGMLKIALTLTSWYQNHVSKPIVGFFRNAGSWLISEGKSIIQGQMRGMLIIASTLANWFRSHVYNPTINFFKATPGWLVSHGKNLITGLLRGQLIIAATIRSWFMSHVYNPTISFFRNTPSWLLQAGRNIINGMYAGLRAIWTTVNHWLGGRPAAVVAAIGATGRLLYQKGRDVINGLLSGLKSVWHDLTSWVSGIAKWIKDHKGPLSLDSRLLTPAGKALMHGLLHGLKIGFKDVGEFTYGIGDSVADVIGKIKKLFSAGLGAVGLGNPKAVGAAQQWAQLYMRAKYGWSGPQWGALKSLWTGESGWRYNALNKSSGAYGIPQALPASKMASAGSDWRTNYATQIKWGLSYIKSRYGSPAAAYGAWLRRSPHWYDAGGIAKGIGAWFKNTNQPERVLSPRQTAAFDRLVGHLTAGGMSTGGATTVINRLVLENHGVIGSKHEVMNWLVEVLDQLERRRRR